MTSELDVIKPLREIVESNNYQIQHTVFRNIIGKIIDANRLLELKGYLEKFLENAPTDFYSNHLAIVVLSVYEKYIDKEAASEIALKIIRQSAKPSFALASLLRICRTNGNYIKADKIFDEVPSLLKIQNFAVLYELTFYYSSKNNINAIDNIIKILVSLSNNNLPILKTANALSIKYGLYEKYQNQLSQLEYKFISDNTNSIISTIDEEEYQKVFRSAALADLTNGIAHEFGQPVTNIRYGIQYYTKLFEDESKDTVDKQKVLNIFKDILIQTDRIGKLINTLSPITSAKSVVSTFSLKDAINEIFEQENIKLKQYEIESDFKFQSSETMIKFDHTQFNQIITNLFNNSIDSILEKKKEQQNLKGKIFITIKYFNNRYSIWVVDNGKGIKQSDYDRIFNPFYTTKPPDKGQGLGLYIVSNLLKMNGGNISLDRSYKFGAKFIVLIPQNKVS